MLEQPRSPFSVLRFVPLGVLILAAVVFVASGGRHYLTFAALAENREWLCDMAQRSGLRAALLFIFAYTGLIALSIPGGLFFTVAGGFLFGPWLGTAYAVTGATLGATIAFFAARAGLAGLLGCAGPWVRRVEAGFRKNALNYLLVLRLIPIFPFWGVNLIAGAVGLRLPVFLLGTFIGIIPATFIFASLGNGFGAVIAEGHSPDADVLFDPSVFLPIVGLALLVLLPVAWKWWRSRRGRAAA